MPLEILCTVLNGVKKCRLRSKEMTEDRFRLNEMTADRSLLDEPTEDHSRLDQTNRISFSVRNLLYVHCGSYTI